MTFNPQLHLVENLYDVDEFLGWLLCDEREFLAIDTETNGLEWWHMPIRLVQFGDSAQGWVLSYKDWRGVIKTALEQYKGPVAYFNAKFDQHFIESNGLPLPSGRAHDVAVMAHLLDARDRPDLKSLAKKYIHPKARDNKSLLTTAFKAHGWFWDTIPEEAMVYWGYSALDPVFTACLAEMFWPRIVAEGFEAPYGVEMQTADIVRQMEVQGVRLDKDLTRSLIGEWSNEIAEIEDTVTHKYEIENLGSGDQLRKILLDDGWVPELFTKTGKAKLDKEVLEGLEHELGLIIQRYKRLVKWKSTYLDTFMRHAEFDGRLHCSIRPFKAKTHRMSISDPPMQTLPRGSVIRNCVIADPGHVIVSIDYDQIEARIMATYSGDENLLRVIRNGEDVHNNTATALYGPDFTPEQRTVCKNGFFSKIYGAGIAKFASTAKIPYKEAKDFYESFVQTYPGIKHFMDEIVAIGHSRLHKEGMGYILLPESRRRLIADDDKMYALTNYLIQGRAAEVLKHTMIELHNAGFTKYMLLPIHDEILYNFPEDEADELTKTAVEIMQDLTTFDVPLTVEASAPMKMWQK